MTENIVCWAVEKGSKSLEERLGKSHRGLLYNIRKIPCPFQKIKVKRKAFSYNEFYNVSNMNADWYAGTTYGHELSAFAALGRKYKEKLLFFGSTLLDTDNENLDIYLEIGIEQEELIHLPFEKRSQVHREVMNSPLTDNEFARKFRKFLEKKYLKNKKRKINTRYRY